jgi:hypothetical protein
VITASFVGYCEEMESKITGVGKGWQWTRLWRKMRCARWLGCVRRCWEREARVQRRTQVAARRGHLAGLLVGFGGLKVCVRDLKPEAGDVTYVAVAIA